MLALELVSEAAMSLLHKDLATNTKATVHFNITCHFDTTSRSNIDGEWPSIILSSSAPICKEYQLQPLFLAYEDCDQITRLLYETFECLASAVSIQEGGIIQAETLRRKLILVIHINCFISFVKVTLLSFVSPV